MPFAFGFQAVGAALVAWRAAIRWRGLPPIQPKRPPAKTVEPETASAWTMPFAFGFQPVAAPRVPSRAALVLRAWPPIDMSRPPAETVGPDRSSECHRP